MGRWAYCRTAERQPLRAPAARRKHPPSHAGCFCECQWRCRPPPHPPVVVPDQLSKQGVGLGLLLHLVSHSVPHLPQCAQQLADHVVLQRRAYKPRQG